MTQVIVSQEILRVGTPSTPEVVHENSPAVADKPSQEVEVPEFPNLTIEEEEPFRRSRYNPTDASLPR